MDPHQTQTQTKTANQTPSNKYCNGYADVLALNATLRNARVRSTNATRSTLPIAAATVNIQHALVVAIATKGQDRSLRTWFIIVAETVSHCPSDRIPPCPRQHNGVLYYLSCSASFARRHVPTAIAEDFSALACLVEFEQYAQNARCLRLWLDVRRPTCIL